MPADRNRGRQRLPDGHISIGVYEPDGLPR